MAEVLLGRLRGASGFERLVALKRVLPSLSDQPAFTGMFLDEARLIASIRHANVVQVFELLEAPGELCIVMEYLEGESLASVREALAVSARPLPPALALWVVAEVAAGVHAAHQLTAPDGASLEVVHRDLTPHNVLITSDGAVKLLDFGVAHAKGRMTRTESGTIKGKLEYMSPEQSAGETIDRRSDVFSLGIILWELLTGRTLFRRTSLLAVARAIAEEPVMPPSRMNRAIPPSVDAVCMKALSRPLEHRFQTAAELRRELLAVAGGLDEKPGPDAVAALMAELFAPSLESRREMVRRATEAPTALVTSASLRVPAPARWKVVAGVALGGAALVAGVWAASGARARTVEGSPPLSVEAAPVSPPVTASPPAAVLADEVRVRFESVPEGARVALDGAMRGVTPLELRLPRSSQPVRVAMTRAGFVELSSELVPDGDQKLTLKLQSVPRSSRPRPPARNAPDPLDEKW